MPAPFTPTVYILFGNQKPSKIFSVQTYKEVKKNMKKYLEESPVNEVLVFRHRRGEWGEWGETWGYNHKRQPVIIEEGWS